MGKQFSMMIFPQCLFGNRVRCFAAASKTLLRQSFWLMMLLLGWASTAQTANSAAFAVSTTGVTAGGIIIIAGAAGTTGSGPNSGPASSAPGAVGPAALPTATVITRISFDAADVNKSGQVFVTALVPAKFLGSSVTELSLAQLTPSGWQALTNSQLIPYASGVLGDQLAAQTILNNTDTTNLTGAQFCVGYGTSASEMIYAGRMQVVATMPNATNANSASCIVTPPAPNAQTIGSITFSPTGLSTGGSTTASAIATSGLAVSFSSTTPSVCTVSGSTVTGISAGACTIAANQAGNATYYAAAQVTATIHITLNAQTIGAITFSPGTLTSGGSTTASAIATSGLAVSFSSTTPSVCTVSGSTVYGISAGACTIAANQLGNATYNAAAQVTQSVQVTQPRPTLGQTIGAITFSPATLTVGVPSTFSATSTSGLPVSFSSLSPSVCYVNNNIVTAVAAGICTIAANQAGNISYMAAPQKTVDIQAQPISLNAQTIGAITFSPGTLTSGGSTTASAIATSGLAVSFSSTTPSVCTVSGSTVTGISAGACTIAANQLGNATYYAAAQATQSIQVTQPQPTLGQTIGAITFSPATLTAGGSTTVSAIATSGLAVSFSSATPSVCTVFGSTVYGITNGICTIAAYQPGDAIYSAAPQVTQSITVGNAVATLYTLSVANFGSGSGTVTSSDGNINCGSTCSATFTSGASVTLTATPSSGSTFTGWSGACTGTGTCALSIGAATNVTATFNLIPFPVATTGVTAGIITAPVATVTTTISVNAADVGQTRSVFITAMMPQSAIGTTLAMTGSNGSRMRALAAPAANSLVLMNLTSSGWQPVVNGQLIPYTTGVLSTQTAAITILNNANTASLGGSQFCVGYGTSVTEMNSAGRMQLIATISDPNAASAATASCILISDARVFAYAEANYSSIFTGTATAGQATYQGNQYDYRYYPASGNYLGVDTFGMIYLLGPYTSNALTPVGQVESYRTYITDWEATR